MISLEKRRGCHDNIECPFWFYYSFGVKLLRMAVWLSPAAQQPAEGFTLHLNRGKDSIAYRQIYR